MNEPDDKNYMQKNIHGASDNLIKTLLELIDDKRITRAIYCQWK